MKKDAGEMGSKSRITQRHHFKFSPRGENRMNKVTCSITMSLDAFVAGPNQSFEKPFGDIPENLLHHWMFDEPGKHQAEINALTDAGAFIMGSNMFGPKEKRESNDWKGWPQWGDNPPYHAPVFVLSHKQRDPIGMEGGTTYIDQERFQERSQARR